eukprot:GHRR01016755.1.p1 GENE.GHRR01016755.1~~GHRR01016755.1.p1  ORF type:complete len:811 (+),score=382.45 GHRR01016755.1:752-3184(+)
MALPLVRSAYQHLASARTDASRLTKELAELKSSRVQHIPPSAWVKREHKYKMDQEKYEHTINMLQQRIERLELELQLLREGANLQPLEQRISELESQLVAAAEEKTKVQSKYHELSIKHRQLIETSPQVATIWNEVLAQQAAAHDVAAVQRLVNFDLRHTGANSSLSMPTGVAGAGRPPGVVSPRKSPGVSAAAAIFTDRSGWVPAPSTAAAAAAASAVRQYGGLQAGPLLAVATSIEQPGPGSPILSGGTAPLVVSSARGAKSSGWGAADNSTAADGSTSISIPAADEPQTAEGRANALMAAVALEGLSPEASIAALQQLNYDLTMQLGLYQQMVGRLKDAMEQSDLEKAELEADKAALEAQVTSSSSSGAAAGGDGGAVAGVGNSGSNRQGRWGLFWRRGSAGTPAAADDADYDSNFADGLSLRSVSSRRSSVDLDLAAPAAVALTAAGGREAASTPVAAAADDYAYPSHSAGTPVHGGSTSAQPGAAADEATATSSGAPLRLLGSGSGGIFSGRRSHNTAVVAKAASAAEGLQQEVKELKRKMTSMQDECKFLVEHLVQIKMELAETQSQHDQAKRALVRAMDKEAVLDLKVAELTNMLDMVTRGKEPGPDSSDLRATASMEAAGAASTAAEAEADSIAAASTSISEDHAAVGDDRHASSSAADSRAAAEGAMQQGAAVQLDIAGDAAIPPAEAGDLEVIAADMPVKQLISSYALAAAATTNSAPIIIEAAAQAPGEQTSGAAVDTDSSDDSLSDASTSSHMYEPAGQDGSLAIPAEAASTAAQALRHEPAMIEDNSDSAARSPMQQ